MQNVIYKHINSQFEGDGLFKRNFWNEMELNARKVHIIQDVKKMMLIKFCRHLNEKDKIMLTKNVCNINYI